tara:strand:- start:233 stop:457 length:225 start_codon:yes stop_codon:yes gene_type:complete
MKIRVKAEETVYLEYFVEVPEEILEEGKIGDRLSKTYLKKAIHKWINENESEFDYQDYDSVKEWYEWEEVEDND